MRLIEELLKVVARMLRVTRLGPVSVSRKQRMSPGTTLSQERCVSECDKDADSVSRKNASRLLGRVGGLIEGWNAFEVQVVGIRGLRLRVEGGERSARRWSGAT